MINIKRPIVLITVGALIGIILGLYLQIGIVFICIVLFIYQFLNSSTKRYIKIFFNKKLILIFLISIIIFYLHLKLAEINYNKIYLSPEMQQLTGKIVSREQETNYYNKYILKYKNKKFIILTSKNQKLEYGDLINITAQYIEPDGARNYKGFDYKLYLKTQKIYGTLKAENIKIIDKKTCSKIFQVSNKIQESIIKNTKEILPQDISAVLLGIILGEKNEIEEEIKENFKKSSLSHVLAVSGMHVSYIIIGITFIITNLKIHKKIGYVITIILIIIFMFLTNFTFSVVRAGIMAIILILSKIFYRKSDVWTTISISALITIVYNPYAILEIGFQLSYAGTIGIIYFNKNITNYLQKYINKKVATILAVPISAQILILPITAINFNTVSFTFLFSNLLASPIIGIIMTFGLSIIIISFMSFKIAIFFSVIMKFFIKILLFISEKFAQILLSQIFITTPNICVILIYYIIVILINYLINIKNKPSRRYQKKIIKKLYNRKTIIYVFAILLIIQIISKINFHKFTINFIDVGQRR